MTSLPESAYEARKSTRSSDQKVVPASSLLLPPWYVRAATDRHRTESRSSPQLDRGCPQFRRENLEEISRHSFLTDLPYVTDEILCPDVFRWNLLQEAVFDGVAEQQSTDPLSILSGGVNPRLDLVNVTSLIR